PRTAAVAPVRGPGTGGLACCFFFQAEDGIRDGHVTGVQTCALPIFSAHVWLGVLSFLLILMHAGFRWGSGLAALLMWLFLAIVVSGLFGIAVQNYVPRRMTE